ncbi:MAG: hypothetical protein M0P61_06420 [Ignavibacteriaceae bacterium]|jgi:hypothetical protein|nr:hypothetical protein [Ignavibacteriaceae bacterium]
MKKNLIDTNQLRSPGNFAKDKGISKVTVYDLMKKEILDVTEIEGFKFIHLTDKTKKYKKTVLHNG